MQIVPGTVQQVLVVRQMAPRRTPVIRAVDARFVALRLHNRPQPAGPRRRNRNADLPQQTFLRQPRIAADIGPAVPAVVRFPQAAVRPAADKLPEVPVHLPDRGENDARVRRVQRKVHRAGLLAHVQHTLPAAAAVRRTVDAPFFIRPERMPQRRHVDDIRVARMNPNLTDMMAVAQAHILPGLSAVGRLVDAVSPADIQPDRRLPCPRVDHVRVRLRYRNRAHRRDVEIAVADVLPVVPAVDCLPNTARHRAKIEDILLRRMTRHRDHAPASGRADAAKTQCVPA